VTKKMKIFSFHEGVPMPAQHECVSWLIVTLYIGSDILIRHIESGRVSRNSWPSSREGPGDGGLHSPVYGKFPRQTQ
jgi:hypothetical protein